MDTKYTIEITREDIDKSDWHCHYCPETLALKRKLKELGICFFGAKIKPSKTYKTIEATIYYPVVKDGMITTSSYHTKIKSDIQWSKEMDQCYESSATASYQLGGVYLNTNYARRKKSSIQPTDYEIKLSNNLFETSDYSWIKEIRGEQTLCTPGFRHRIEDLEIEKELLEFKSNPIFIFDWLSCGELALRDFSNYKEVRLVDTKKRKLYKKPGGEILIPTCSFKFDIFKTTLNEMASKFIDKENILIYVAIRQISFGEIEAAIAILYGKKTKSPPKICKKL